MSSNRLRKVYESAKWRREIRPAVIDRAGGQCQFVMTNVFGELVRCPVRDKKYGGTESLTVQHSDLFADPYDIEKLVALCRRHHGQQDGGRAARSRRETW